MAQSQLEKLRIRLGIKTIDQDDLLELLLEEAKDFLLTETNRATLPVSLESTQRQLAIISYNMQGIEGQTSHSEGGVSRSFESLSPSIQKTIVQHRLLKAARYAT